jgi:hypothetical protein
MTPLQPPLYSLNLLTKERTMAASKKHPKVLTKTAKRAKGSITIPRRTADKLKPNASPQATAVPPLTVEPLRYVQFLMLSKILARLNRN